MNNAYDYEDVLLLTEALNNDDEVDLDYPVTYPLICIDSGSSASVFLDQNGEIIRVSENAEDNQVDYMSGYLKSLPRINHSDVLLNGSITIRPDYKDLPDGYQEQMKYVLPKKTKLTNFFNTFRAFLSDKIDADGCQNDDVVSLTSYIATQQIASEGILSFLSTCMRAGEKYQKTNNQDVFDKMITDAYSKLLDDNTIGNGPVRNVKNFPLMFSFAPNGISKTQGCRMFVGRMTTCVHNVAQCLMDKNTYPAIRKMLEFHTEYLLEFGIPAFDSYRSNFGVDNHGNLIFRDFYHVSNILHSYKFHIDNYRNKKGLSAIHWEPEDAPSVRAINSLIAIDKGDIIGLPPNIKPFQGELNTKCPVFPFTPYSDELSEKYYRVVLKDREDEFERLNNLPITGHIPMTRLEVKLPDAEEEIKKALGMPEDAFIELEDEEIYMSAEVESLDNNMCVFIQKLKQSFQNVKPSLIEILRPSILAFMEGKTGKLSDYIMLSDYVFPPEDSRLTDENFPLIPVSPVTRADQDAVNHLIPEIILNNDCARIWEIIESIHRETGQYPILETNAFGRVNGEIYLKFLPIRCSEMRIREIWEYRKENGLDETVTMGLR